MTLIITSNTENTISIPNWLMAALHLREGEHVEALIEDNTLRVARQNPALPANRFTPKLQPGDETFQADADEPSSLEATVAWIKASPPNPNAIEHATKTVDELIADLAANPPSNNLLTFGEFYPLWMQFEEGLKAMEQADDIQEGCV